MHKNLREVTFTFSDGSNHKMLSTVKSDTYEVDVLYYKHPAWNKDAQMSKADTGALGKKFAEKYGSDDDLF
jgi:ribosomal protein L31